MMTHVSQKIKWMKLDLVLQKHHSEEHNSELCHPNRGTRPAFDEFA